MALTHTAETTRNQGQDPYPEIGDRLPEWVYVAGEATSLRMRARLYAQSGQQRSKHYPFSMLTAITVAFSWPW
jgi:hypothetical protein